MNPQDRLTDIHNKLVSILTKETVTICIDRCWDGKSSVFGYEFDSDVWNYSGRYRVTQDRSEADILIIIAVGNDHPNLRRNLEQIGFTGIICFWLYDNHLSHEKNRTTVMEGDFYFCSHHGDIHENYLLNEQSIAGPVLPLAYLGCSTDIVSSMISKFNGLPRLSKVVAPYFLYDFQSLPRTAFLDQLQVNHPEFVCLYTRAENRQSDYHNAFSEDEKNARWLYFKSSIVVPLNQDLSNRLFHGLIWGHTVLVPNNLPAFEYVFSETEQKKLGIVRFDMEGGNEAIRSAAREAIKLFDDTGADGVAYRHNFVLEGHTRAHRVRSILQFLEDFIGGKTTNKLLLGDGISGLKSSY